MISGSSKGRALKAVTGFGTRPTTDKVKEAIFSMIGPYFAGGSVLDLYAGTGALGIEALSRGMDKAIFVDADKKCIDVIRENLRATGLSEQAEVYRNDAERALKALAKRQLAFKLVFLDPPYKNKQMDKLLHILQEENLIQDGTIAVVEHDAAHAYPERIGGFSAARLSVYGDTAVTVYRYETQAISTALTGDEQNEERG